ncbi:PLD nuclease N-terminal domain-containing protein [Antribacter gilvus]|uniref:PLD nuclease N-terminal domain-containing protein n=1 Tax=Antribacter gilvus TaxID=2304675 RepID=UPI0013DF923B|nr:PLD nuclease N-terminal domain-containing protein [Antribacter gilvus]
MVRVLIPLLYVALVVYALVDVVQSDEEDTGGIGKGLWIFAIVFLPLVGSIAWIVVSSGSRRRRGVSRRSTGFPAGEVPPAQYPKRERTWEKEASTYAPEDDPEFLWLMEQAKKKREREAQGRGNQEPGATAPDAH